MSKFSLSTSLVNKEKISVRNELKAIIKKFKCRPDSKNGHIGGENKKSLGKNSGRNKVK